MGEWLVTFLSLREEQRPLKAGVMEAEKNTARSDRHRSHRADKTQGGKRQPKRVRKTMERGRERVRGASLTVQVLFLGAHDLVGRGLAYCLRYRGASDTVLGRGDSVRQALARHLCGSSATPSAPQPAGPGTPKRPRVPTPHRTPYPPPAPGPPAGLGRGSGPRAATRSESPGSRVPHGLPHQVGALPGPAPQPQPTPSLVSWSPTGQEGQAAAGKWRRQAPPRSFPGCPCVT